MICWDHRRRAPAADWREAPASTPGGGFGPADTFSTKPSHNMHTALLAGSFLFLFLFQESAHSSQVSPRDSSDLPPSCRQVAQSTSEGSELVRALTTDGSAVSYARLGQFYLEGGAAECARFAFQNAVSKDAELWKAHYGLGLAFLQQGETKRAVEELRRVLQQVPQDSRAHNALGLGLEAMGDFDSSEREFKTALDLDPEFDMACFNLAHVLGAQGKYPAVTFYLKKAVALAPQQPAYRLALGGLTLRTEISTRPYGVLTNSSTLPLIIPMLIFNSGVLI